MKTNVKEKVIKLSKKLYEPFKKLREKQNKLGEKYENINTEDLLIIDGLEFNLFFAFDDINQLENEDTVIVMNMFYADLETKKSKSFIRQNFPSFNKIVNKIEELREPEIGGYITIGKNVSENDETSIIFKTYEEFEAYASQFSVLESLYKQFLKEVEDYAKKQVFIEVSNSGIKERKSNGRRFQEILLKTQKNVFKIFILSESYDFQSYGKLSILSKDKTWTVLKTVNPKLDYNIDIAYKDDYDENAFSKIIHDFKDIAEQIDI